MNLLIFIILICSISSRTESNSQQVSSNIHITYIDSIPENVESNAKFLGNKEKNIIKVAIDNGSSTQEIYINLNPQEEPEISKPTNTLTFAQIAISSIISVTLCSLCALLGFFIMFFQNTRYYNSILIGFSALGVGALMSSAILVLIPDSIPMSEMPISLGGGKDRIYLNKMTATCVGIMFCLLIEYLIRTLFKSDYAHSHDIQEASPMKSIEDKDERVSYKIENSSLKKKLLKPVVMMIILGDGIHNFMDGVSIASAFSQSFSSGLTISISVFMEELPHELGDFGILLISGLTVKECFMMNGISALSAYLGLIPGLAIGQFGDGANYVMAFTGGLFLYISLCEMLPELLTKINQGNRTKNFILLFFGIIIGTAAIFGVTKVSDFI